jgi:hypothetical protein
MTDKLRHRHNFTFVALATSERLPEIVRFSTTGREVTSTRNRLDWSSVGPDGQPRDHDGGQNGLTRMLSRSSLSEMLRGRTPAAMYDVLHARRCLSDRALRRPDEVLDFLRSFFRTARQAAFLPRLADALAGSPFLNEEGRRLAEAKPTEE